MVARLIHEERIEDAKLARAMLRVPRYAFLPPALHGQAWDLDAVEVLAGQTITCPGFVAQMTTLLDIRPGSRVLEVGSGTGYQAAILKALGANVVSVEVRPALHELARTNLARAGFNVDLRLGDGYLGAPDAGPFDAILLACAPEQIPQTLVEQLADGGVLVGPEGETESIQTLVVIRRDGERIIREEVRGAWFVPMVRRS